MNFIYIYSISTFLNTKNYNCWYLVQNYINNIISNLDLFKGYSKPWNRHFCHHKPLQPFTKSRACSWPRHITKHSTKTHLGNPRYYKANVTIVMRESLGTRMFYIYIHIYKIANLGGLNFVMDLLSILPSLTYLENLTLHLNWRVFKHWLSYPSAWGVDSSIPCMN